jgi:hypothetical protein
MTTIRSATSSVSFGVVGVLAMLVGGMILGYGLLLFPLSGLGGSWIAASGFSLLLSGLFATEWFGNRLGLSVTGRRTLSLTFAVFTVFLLVSFVVVNFASFEFAESRGSG